MTQPVRRSPGRAPLRHKPVRSGRGLADGLAELDATMKRLLLAVLALAAFAQAAALAGGDPEARFLLETIYKPYADAAAQEASVDVHQDEDARNARIYVPELAALLARDRQEAEARGLSPRLDFDPLTYSQDWETTPVDITAEDAGPGKARGQATYTLFSKTTIIRFDLVKTNAGWRIADVHWNDDEEGLKDILSRPLP
jgi:hypothetical protein